MTYIGIDPGKNGAMAVLKEDRTFRIVPYGPQSYADELEFSEADCIVCLEHVGAMPRQGVNSMFHFGENFGFIQGLLTAFAIPYELVRPQKWKKEFSITGDKNSSIQVCKRLFPAVNLRKEGGRKDNDGMAEALLMAEYARRRLSRG